MCTRVFAPGVARAQLLFCQKDVLVFHALWRQRRSLGKLLQFVGMFEGEGRESERVRKRESQPKSAPSVSRSRV